MPTQEQINSLTQIVENIFCLFDVKLTEESALADFHADELDAAEFLMAFEEEFKISTERFDNSSLKEISSLEEINKLPLFEFFNEK